MTELSCGLTHLHHIFAMRLRHISDKGKAVQILSVKCAHAKKPAKLALAGWEISGKA
jgi:hypothetical protein